MEHRSNAILILTDDLGGAALWTLSSLIGQVNLQCTLMSKPTAGLIW
jgi:hypothetical protein